MKHNTTAQAPCLQGIEYLMAMDRDKLKKKQQVASPEYNLILLGYITCPAGAKVLMPHHLEFS